MKSLRSFLTVISMTMACLANGEDSKHLFHVALQAEAKGNFDEAISFYEEAAAQAHTANLHGNLANLHFKVGNHGKASRRGRFGGAHCWTYYTVGWSPIV